MKTPTKEDIQNACREFENDIGEITLQGLFDLYPKNDNHAHVLLKVVALNRIYSAGVLAVYDVARHVFQNAAEIDLALDRGDPDIVDKIAKVAVGERVISFYSFASKYCGWHKPALYPLWDSRVARYLAFLRKTDFARFLTAHGDLWTRYSEFVQIMSDLKAHFELNSFTFKQVDLFIWSLVGRETGALGVAD